MRFSTTLSSLLGISVAIPLPDDALPSQDLQQPGWFVKAGMPLFYFAAGSCYPEAAVINGTQARGGRHFAYSLIDRDCKYRIPKHRPHNSPGPTVPVYWDITACAEDLSIRVLYDLYFAHDSGHKHDFEWVAVVWKANETSQTWERDSIILEQDNHHPTHKWADFGTFNNITNLHEWHSDEENFHGDHPRIYVDKWQHAMWWNSFTKAFEGDGAVLPSHRWRTNDWYLYNETSLTHIDAIDPDWNYGKARNPHKTMKDLCSY